MLIRINFDWFWGNLRYALIFLLAVTVLWLSLHAVNLMSETDVIMIWWLLSFMDKVWSVHCLSLWLWRQTSQTLITAAFEEHRLYWFTRSFFALQHRTFYVMSQHINFKMIRTTTWYLCADKGNMIHDWIISSNHWKDNTLHQVLLLSGLLIWIYSLIAKTILFGAFVSGRIMSW